MTVYNIIKLGEKGEEVLRTVAAPVRQINASIHRLLDNMRETMYFHKGVGLAAPQIGVAKRVIVVDVGEGLVELINPVIVSSSGEVIDVEGCLSIPGVLGEVKRAAEVVVKGLNRAGEEVIYEARDMFARALQHEIDHLNGILFIDRAQNLQRSTSRSAGRRRR